jgi:hypothetical protein
LEKNKDGHQRKYLETMIDIRKMEDAELETKWAWMIVGESTQRTEFILRDISSLRGSSKNFTRYIK